MLTLSIGLGYTDLPSTVKAQNSELFHGGIDDYVEDGIEHKHTTNHDNQAVTGEGNILSGNNLLCEDMSNSNSVFKSNQICNLQKAPSPTTTQLYFYAFTNVEIVNFTMTISGEPSISSENLDSGPTHDFQPTTIPIPSTIVMEGTAEGLIDPVFTYVTRGGTVCNISDNQRQFVCQAEIPSVDLD